MVNTAVILAGGRGSRLSEKTGECPKPLLPVDGIPILQRLINYYLKWGVKSFIIPTGYLAGQIFDYFANRCEWAMVDERGAYDFGLRDYSVTLLYTGDDTLTGSRLKMLEPYLPEEFYFTYGDGLSNICSAKVADKLHQSEHTLVVLSAVHPEPRFGELQISYDDTVSRFGEKKDNLGYINGGFACMSKRVLSYIGDGTQCNLESDIFPLLAQAGHMTCVRHEGVWHCIDTLRDLEKADELVRNGVVE